MLVGAIVGGSSAMLLSAMLLSAIGTSFYIFFTQSHSPKKYISLNKNTMITRAKYNNMSRTKFTPSQMMIYLICSRVIKPLQLKIIKRTGGVVSHGRCKRVGKGDGHRVQDIFIFIIFIGTFKDFSVFVAAMLDVVIAGMHFQIFVNLHIIIAVLYWNQLKLSPRCLDSFIWEV